MSKVKYDEIAKDARKCHNTEQQTIVVRSDDGAPPGWHYFNKVMETN